MDRAVAATDVHSSSMLAAGGKVLADRRSGTAGCAAARCDVIHGVVRHWHLFIAPDRTRHAASVHAVNALHAVRQVAADGVGLQETFEGLPSERGLEVADRAAPGIAKVLDRTNFRHEERVTGSVRDAFQGTPLMKREWSALKLSAGQWRRGGDIGIWGHQ